MPDDVGDGRAELAFRMATDHLAAQFAALDELRGRVGVVLSGAGVATGFLAGQALNTQRGFPVAAAVACLAALLLMIVSACILWPRTWGGLTQNAQRVLDDIETSPERTMIDYYSAMAGYAVTAARENDQRLNVLYRWFSASLILLVLDFAGWITVLATNWGAQRAKQGARETALKSAAPTAASAAEPLRAGDQERTAEAGQGAPIEARSAARAVRPNMASSLLRGRSTARRIRTPPRRPQRGR